MKLFIGITRNEDLIVIKICVGRLVKEKEKNMEQIIFPHLQ